MELSVKASGEYCGFTAEASASGGVNSSLKDMNQSISKVAKKAAQSVSSHNKQEVSSSSTSRTRIANVDETTATIRNINQGRSLNLFFYRLYNKYNGGLYLENLRFDVIKSTEVIEGSGVFESVSYSLNQLPGMLEELKSAQLPFAITDTDRYSSHLLDSIEELLRNEYIGLLSDDAGAKAIFSCDNLSTSDPVPTPTDSVSPDEINALEKQSGEIKTSGVQLDKQIEDQQSLKQTDLTKDEQDEG